MEPFLQQAASHYYKEGIANTLFIFPNRRSASFFRKYLGAEIKGKPVLAPGMLTINDFFYKVYGVGASHRVRLLVELYDVYKGLYPNAEPLDEFIFWGNTLLQDFDDVDKYLVNAKGLFANVSDFKAIQDSGFTLYKDISICDGFPPGWNGEGILDTMRQGIEQGVWCPEYHAMLHHTSPRLWLELLREDSKDGELARKLFALGTYYQGKHLPEFHGYSISEQMDFIVTGFERFYQAKGQAQTGSGIGLNIVREIVSRHHGTIIPENSDEGLRFTLYFPRLEQNLAKT